MSETQNIMPEIVPFPRVQRVINAGKFIWHLGNVTESCLTEHNSGAEVMLEKYLRAEASDY